jgi:two-component sensor histidine kinase
MTFPGAVEAEKVALVDPAIIAGVEAEAADDRSEIQLRMLELRHRIKNILAVVQSVANQTLRDGMSIAEARQELAERLFAVGQAVDLLLSGAWEGTTLDKLIPAAMTLGGGRLDLSGPRIDIGPTAAMLLSILFHELECNAIKYGALSTAEGAVSVSWAVSDGGTNELRLEWQETGGPSVKTAGSHGFGSKLTSRIAARLNGISEADLHPEGLRWTLRAPISSLGG